MEILRPAYSTEIRERAGYFTIPDLISFSTNIPGRAIDSTIDTLKLGNFSDHLEEIRQAGRKDKKKLDKVGIYYLNGTDTLSPGKNNFFSENEGRDTITVEVDPPRINSANPRKYLPKEKSVAAIIHYSQTDTLPMPDNLLHLLLEDNHFKAATAAFFLTSRDNLYALFRTRQTPQANSERARRIVGNMRTVAKEFHWTEGVNMQTANMCVLNEAIHEYGLLFFQTKLGNGPLRKSGPSLHFT